jgi:hypothetical protein
MNKQWHHKYPSKHGNQQDENNRKDAHNLFEPARVVLPTKWHFLAPKMDRTCDKCPANLVSPANHNQQDENFE